MPPYDDARRPRLIADAARRWWLVAGVAVATVVLAVGFTHARSTTYIGHASVLVYPVAGAPFEQQLAGEQLIDLTTEAQIVRSDSVAGGAAAELKRQRLAVPSVGALLAAVEATVETNTQVLTITYRSSSRAQARAGADAFATAYLDHRRAQAKGAAERSLTQVDEQEAKLKRGIASAEGRLAGTTPGSTEAGRINAEIKVDSDSLNDIIAQKLDIRDRPIIPGQVLSPATVPQRPNGVRGSIIVAFAIIIGLLLGAILASARERMVGRIRRPDYLSTEPPLLSVVPHVSDAAIEPVMLTAPEHQAAEAYRFLHVALDAALPVDVERGNVVVVAPVTGSIPPVAANLAIAAANAGRIATLVEAVPVPDDRCVPPMLMNRDGLGLSDTLLTGADAVANRFHATRGLTVLSPGADLERAAEGYVGPRMRHALDSLRRAADVVVVTSPPLSDPDGQALAAVADSVVLVVTLDESTRRDLESALGDARQVHADVIGVVAVTRTSRPRWAPAAAVQPVEESVVTSSDPTSTRVGT